MLQTPVIKESWEYAVFRILASGGSGSPAAKACMVKDGQIWVGVRSGAGTSRIYAFSG
jgi:hypothetical protein